MNWMMKTCEDIEIISRMTVTLTELQIMPDYIYDDLQVILFDLWCRNNVRGK